MPRSTGTTDLSQRLARLERRSAWGWALATLLGVALLAGARGTGPEELRAQRLVIEDSEGRPRIVIAAPITRLPGRVRSDETCGVLVLDERGIDRVVVGSPTTDPQVEGEVGRRIGPASGINFNDRNGNERGGLGVLDNDNRAVLGLDRDRGEGVALFVTPDYAGLILNGGEGEHRGQRAFLGTSSASDRTVFNLDDHRSRRRFQITIAPDEAPKLEFYDEHFEPILKIPPAPAGAPVEAAAQDGSTDPI